MPGKTQPRSVAEQVDDEIKQEISDLVSQIAAEEGPAPHAQYVSDDHEVDMWGQQDPQVDHETLVQQLMQGAVPPELVDPNGDHAYAAVKGDPAWAQMLTQPLDAEMAQLVATWTEYPFRKEILAPYRDDPKASIKKSDSLTARWRRRLPPRTPMLQPVAQPGTLPAPASASAAGLPGAQGSLGAPIPPPAAPAPLTPLSGPPAASAGMAGASPPLPAGGPRPGGY